MWLKVEGFKDLLRGWWQEAGGRGRASFRVASKLKFLKDKIKSWNREVFGRVEVNKNLALQQVDFWDRVESDRSLTERELELKTEAKEAFKNWVLLEETHWRQSSRELWLREGDKNTGFFHRMANAHRRNNSMDKIKINGRWLEEEREVREGVVNAFQQLLSKDQSWKSDIEGLQLKSLNHAEAEGLEQPFTEVEIHLALMEMNGDKAPGPDGFTVAFWQFCWEFVKEEIVDVFKEFYEDKSFAKSLNSTFLVLIPKKGGAEDLGDFRPISLLGGGRQILDASLIANEVIDYWLKRKEKGVICHAEDGLWGPVVEMDLVVYFKRQAFLFWSMGCQLVISPTLGGYAKHSREGGMEINVSHLLFADDTIIFCEARQDHITYLSWILVWFEATSGLRINLAKSEVIPVGEVEDIEMLAVELGVKNEKKACTVEKTIFVKGWEDYPHQSTLASMPIYQLSLFRMPKLVVKRLEKLQRDFLWGGGSMERKIHLINWAVVCTQKESGGLGIRKN
ncbi:Transposon TX1 uncharacterized 149 kDa protein [Vitis vinifera]|uniref:Transposon TX1 uncharacterized 149 kDa protein n=1 Tax=Vitis vinifera TaxID=29760 RepID=A0A438J134_VITVI|nr:Transposon TX1 uncharacterized 149 kDa protein [Vitis vinifera]